MKVYDGDQAEQGEVSEPDRIKVGIAEYDVTTDGAVLSTSGLGSCVGVALYDDRHGVAGLVHVMLPAADEMEDGNAAKFADAGVKSLIDEMENAGANVEDMTAKMAGGSDMLDFSSDDSSIGDRNIDQVQATLSEYEIPIAGKDVGGDHGRSLQFESQSGDLVVKNANSEKCRL